MSRSVQRIEKSGFFGKLFSEFEDNREYICNVTGKTLEVYENAWKFFGPCLEPLELDLGKRDKDERLAEEKKIVKAIEAHIVHTKKTGQESKSAGTYNCYIRVLNAWLRWAHEEEGVLANLLKVAKQKGESKIIEPLDEQQLRSLYAYKPTTFNQIRASVMAQFTLDVGLRSAECRLLRKADLDHANLLVKVWGKGRKERMAPMSPQGRALIQRYISKYTNPEDEYVFCTATGRPISHRNSLRDLQVVSRRARIIESKKKFFKTLRVSGGHPASCRPRRVGWHTLRHTYGYMYIKNGGNVVKLQANMGHSAVTTTMIYVKLQTKDRVENHGAYSALVASARG